MRVSVQWVPVNVIHYGLGPIGQGIARLLLQRGHTIAGAIDIDPEKAGRDVGMLLGGTPLGVPVATDPAAALRADADIVVHSTGSHLREVLPQLEAAVRAGLDVASTCEELAYPWHHHPDEAARLDGLAREYAATVVGLGVNPGFVMDVLPLLLTAACVEVTRLTVTRVVDAGQRREPLRRKVGAGLTRQAFEAGVRGGTLGHVGLVESVALVADALGWPVDVITEEIAPVIDATGSVLGLHQVAHGFRSAGRFGGSAPDPEQAVIVLDLTMAVGAPRPRDVIAIEGSPTLTMEILGGIHGDLATWAVVVNALPLIQAAPAGLLPVCRLPLMHLAPVSQAGEARRAPASPP